MYHIVYPGWYPPVAEGTMYHINNPWPEARAELVAWNTTSYTVVYPAIRCGTPGWELVHPEADGWRCTTLYVGVNHGVTIYLLPIPLFSSYKLDLNYI